MTSINVCFTAENGVISRVIRWFTRARVSHALITFYDVTLKRVFVMEANGRGFMLTPWTKWRQSNTLYARYELTLEKGVQNEALYAVGGHLGAQYDYVGIISFALRRVCSRFANPWASSSKMFCSEAVALFLKEAGIDPFNEPEDWTPGDLLRAIEKDARFHLIEAADGRTTSP
jgi:hypothetical protein